MSRSHQHRSITSVLTLAGFAASRGMPLARLLAGTGIRPEDLDDPAAVVSFEQEYGLIRNLLAYGDDQPGLGLEVGLRYKFTSLASLGFAVVSSPTIRSAIGITLRYPDLNASLIRVTVEEDSDDMHLGYVDEELPADIRRFAIERTIGATLAIAGDLLGYRVVPRSLSFNFPCPGDAGIYERLAGIAPVFDQTKSRLVLKQHDVDHLLSNSNPIALRTAEDYCRQSLLQWKNRSGFSAEVREYIGRRTDGLPGMEETAAAFCMSSRTMHRRLKEEGVSFLILIDEVRKMLATQLLTVQRLPVEQIAERLGYAESASFIHAFRRWTGQTPHAYRRKSQNNEGNRDIG